MYNQKKHLANKIGSVCSIILGVFVFIGLFITLISFFKVCGKVDMEPRVIAIFLGLVLRGYIGLTFWKVGVETMEEPTLYNDKDKGKAYWIYPSKKKTITLIILASVLFILALGASGLLNGGVGDVSFVTLDWAQWIQNLLCLGVAIPKTIGLLLPDEEPTATAPNNTENKAVTEEKKATVEERINELKRLKETGALSEEQYENAVKELISKEFTQK